MLHVNNETSENGSATFHCVVESRPASTITWKNSSHVLNTSSNANDSYYTIQKANCLQTGTYQCKAENTIDSKVQTVEAEIKFFVLCSVRRDQRKPYMLGGIGIKDEDPLNITEYLVAYPKPTIEWTFKNESIKSNDSFGTFSHYTSILKWQIGINDFGVYTLNASNKFGEPYVRTYDVFSQRKPTPPTNITAECDVIKMKVFWRSESNGGDTQRFKVSWWNQAKNSTIYSREIEDLGEGKYHCETTESLMSNTLYVVFVEATNSQGTVISNERMNCTTKRSK
ncbi:Hypothetical predicted protein [Mytilus galloprovincialis]|uniref:Ig-like domain-containing protein n=1 Tax=Mytilus galloprovincialis TaxID=29158 RepID=A0A8B6EKN2_MYTGA|nr:Hypothetical predicted protein [Mytilus galloprovincialis]